MTNLFLLHSLGLHEQWLRSARPWYVLVTALTIVFALSEGSSLVGDIWIIPLFAALILALAVYEGNGLVWLESRTMTWLGDTSYSIYMTHYFILAIVTRAAAIVMPGYSSNSGLGVMFLIAYILTVVAVSSLTYILIEKPSRSFLRRGDLRLG